MLKKTILAGVLVAAIAGSWVLLSHHSAQAQGAGPGGGGPPEVTVAPAMVRPVSDSADFTGQLQAVDTVDVRPRVGGYVDAVLFKEGAEVHQGDVLFRIDPRPFQAEVDRLTANRAQAQAQLGLAQANAARAKRLLAQHAISQEDADSMSTSEQSATATLAAATAALATAKLNLDWTQVRAPIDGRVSNAHIMPGNLVTSSDVLTSVVSVNPIYVYFDVDEQTWLKLDRLRRDATRNGRNARIEATMGLADEQGYPHEGRIDFVDNQLRPNSGTMRLRAVFDEEDGLLTPGLYAHVRLQSGQPRPRVLIDDRAVGTDLGNQFVYVVDGQHKVQYRKVDTGPLFHGLRVIDDGLNGGDVVVVNGLQHVRPGVEVTPQQVAMDYRLDVQDKALVDAAATNPDGDDTRTAQADNRTTQKRPQG
ncbi:efflux RND transporter periplasmic adaptor subunit [Dyella caseinilytica]|uniref:Efflux RND transporter periplasmic adaptor subunit n=1 Tax=Dyella caseinilytica TaxID=1849581 RepID=A0ABX7GUH2_9GAMM|nr:efflux RND transporter periplasmic adaptor subunit [Dyella caseinilytica]QRN53698.1 efflux RND transporter periplasmic adaptor subunit [Dyella caseinilytica]GFZ88584.1 resistance-nodulation-cell division (RND) multidrug efflux membrane fusion protein MexE [Dyella caseinilytica]